MLGPRPDAVYNAMHPSVLSQSVVAPADNEDLYNLIPFKRFRDVLEGDYSSCTPNGGPRTDQLSELRISGAESIGHRFQGDSVPDAATRHRQLQRAAHSADFPGGSLQPQKNKKSESANA